MKIKVAQACRFDDLKLAFGLNHQKPQIYENVPDELFKNSFFQKLVKAEKIKVLVAPKDESVEKNDESDVEAKPKKGKAKKDE